MHFSCTDKRSGSKAGRFALIAALHVAVGVLLVHSINARRLSLASLPDQVLVMIHPAPPPPPPPPEPPQPMPRLAPPELVVPQVEVAIPPPPDPAPLQATATPAPQPVQATPAPPDSAAQVPAAPAHDSGRMHTAVFADAHSCALPAYPPSAARNGDTGTTLLALLVGADGRVSSARVEHTSGSHELDRAAIRALSLCKFKPAANNGVPEAGWAQLAYVWTLD